MDLQLNETVITAMSLPTTAANTYHPLMSYTGQKCLQDTERRRAGDASTSALCAQNLRTWSVDHQTRLE